MFPGGKGSCHCDGDEGGLPIGQGAFEHYLNANPDDVSALTDLGKIYYGMTHYKSATAAFEKAISLDSNMIEAHLYFAGIAAMFRDFKKALEHFQIVLEKNPNDVRAHRELAPLFFYLGDIEKANQSFDKLQALEPSDAIEMSRRIMLPSVPMSLKSIEESREKYEAGLDEMLEKEILLEPSCRGILNSQFYLSYHGKNNVKLMRKLGQVFRRACPELSFVAPHCTSPKKNEDRPLRVGFISRYFHQHSVSMVFNRIIEKMAVKSDFEIVMIAPTPHPDTIEILKSFELKGASTLILHSELQEAQQLIAQQKLDVLIYTEIGMDPFSYHLAFSRLAPVQGVLPGHPDTSGLPTIDYYIATDLIITDKMHDYITEELVGIPSTIVYATKPNVPDSIKSRKELGLPEGKNIYLCPLMLQKIHPDFDRAIVDILERDSDGVILFFEDAAPVKRPALLKKRFKQSIPKNLCERVLFVPWASCEDFMCYLAQCSVVLDSYHFGLGTTVLFAFAVGAPIVTFPEDLMGSRSSLVYYNMIGVDDLIVDNHEDYVDLAVKLAVDKDFHSEIKGKILDRCDAIYNDGSAGDELPQLLKKLYRNKVGD